MCAPQLFLQVCTPSQRFDAQGSNQWHREGLFSPANVKSTAIGLLSTNERSFHG